MTGQDFWSWSLERYAPRETQALLLDLQDRHALNVNIMLWCGWCAERFDDAPPEAFLEAMALTGAFSQNVTARLRAARRFLKSDSAGAPDAAALKNDIFAVELEAERIEQTRLERLASIFAAAPNAECAARCRRNLEIYASLASAKGGTPAPGQSLRRLASLLCSSNENPGRITQRHD